MPHDGPRAPSGAGEAAIATKQARIVPKGPTLIGWRERARLPQISPDPFTAKIDSGARSSALHAVRIRIVEEDGRAFVSFVPDRLGPTQRVPHRLPLHEERAVTNTSGTPEIRPTVRTRLEMGSRHWTIELTLTDRSGMTHPLILGRTAVRSHRLLLDCGRSYLLPLAGDVTGDPT